MFLLKQLAPGLLAAAFVTGALLALAHWFWGRNSPAGAFAVGAGYLAGHIAAAGWPALPPAEATQWLFYFALAGLLAGALDTSVRASSLSRVGVWLLSSAILLGLLLRIKIQSAWTAPQSILWLTALAAVTLVLTTSLLKIARPNAGAIFTLLVAAIVCGGTGIALVLSGSLLLGQLGFVLAAAVGVALLAAWFFREMPLATGAVPVIVLLLIGLWVSGYFYADLPALSAVLFALALVLPAFFPSIDWNAAIPWKALLLRGSAVAFPVAVGIFVAFRASPSLDY